MIKLLNKNAFNWNKKLIISNLYRVFFQEKGLPLLHRKNGLLKHILPSNHDHRVRKLPQSLRNWILRKMWCAYGSAINDKNKNVWNLLHNTDNRIQQLPNLV